MGDLYNKWVYPLEHTLIAILMLIIGHLTGNMIIASFSASFLFIGREFTQAEYRWITYYGHDKRANMPWWGMFDLGVWDFHSWFWNLTVPISIVLVLNFMDNLYNRG